MAVAEATQVEKSDKGEREKEREREKHPSGAAGGPPSWITWVPRKLAELKQFFADVKSELKKVTWPSQNEVRTTTLVVIVTTVVFGFFLYAMDLGFSQLLQLALGQR